jgi:predicted peptidase
MVSNEVGMGQSQTVIINSLLYLPQSYYQESARQWPFILFLHGSGEAGDDLRLLKQTGLPQLLEHKSDFPFIVVSPQLPAPPLTQDPAAQNDVDAYLNMWGWKSQIWKLEMLLDFMQAHYRVDPDRLYLTGLSLGGFGAWAYALAYPEQFAAIIPIAGGYHAKDDELPEDLCELKDLPIWIFHGQLDEAVDYHRSLALAEGLEVCGAGEVQFTLDPDGVHDVWTEAYADPDLWEWLLAQENDE